MTLLLPVGDRRMSSWAQHQRRSPRSSEPGTDFYCPIGTHILAPDDGYIWGSGESIAPATGRWVGINFHNGMSFRSMHHSRNRITSGYVKRGDVIAFSGASGYGEEDWSWNIADTGGAHTHVTLWPTWDHRFGYDIYGRPFTIDFMQYAGAPAGDGSQPFPKPTPPIQLEDDDMISIHAPGRGVAVIGPGYFKSLTPEESENVEAITTKQIDGSDRQFDLWVAIATHGVAASGA